MHCTVWSSSCYRLVVFGFGLMALLSNVAMQAATVTVSLDARADPTSHFITYFSAGIAQLNMTYPGTSNQPFWNTNDLNQTYNGSFDYFPNENAMRFGELTYDDSTLSTGSGATAITGLTLGIEFDPFDSNYRNGSWLSFSTDLQTYSGSVTVTNGTVTGIDLTADYGMVGSFGGTPVYANGVFRVSGDQFEVLASGAGTPYPQYDPSVEWNWTGMILAVGDAPADDADFNGDGVVNLADYTVWRDHLGATGITPYSLGDANGDGEVSTADYQVWKSQFGGSPSTRLSPSISSVPEPANIVVAAFAATAIAVFVSFSQRSR